MKNKKTYTYKLKPAPDEVIGHLGPVELIQRPDGRCYLAGGTNKQQKFVRKWCNRFASFLVFAEVLPDGHRKTARV